MPDKMSGLTLQLDNFNCIFDVHIKVLKILLVNNYVPSLHLVRPVGMYLVLVQQVSVIFTIHESLASNGVGSRVPQKDPGGDPGGKALGRFGFQHLLKALIGSPGNIVFLKST